MNLHNEYNLEPGVYNFKTENIVVLELITHDEFSVIIADPIVVFRPVIGIIAHVNGRPIASHHVRSMGLNKFRSLISEGIIKRI